jgi:signal transduction histidine kinase
MDGRRLHRIGVILRADVLPTLVVGFVLIMGTGKAAEEHVPTRSLDAVAYAVLALAAATVPLRRHAPLVMLVTASMIVGTYLAVGYPNGPIVFVASIAAYAVAASQPPRRAAAVVLPVAVLIPIAADIGDRQLVLGVDGDWLDWLALVTGSGLLLVPAIIGALVQRSRAYAERAKGEATRRKIEQERLRVAREVHDVVGHSLSIISLQAGVALHVLDRRPEQAQVALEAIRRTSLDALDELRATLALTRAGLRPGSADPSSADAPAADAVSTADAAFAGDTVSGDVSTGDVSTGDVSTGDVGSGSTRPGRSPAGRDLDRAQLGGVNGEDVIAERGIPDIARSAEPAGAAAAVRVPLTGLARLDGLLGEVRLCGVPVELMKTGTPRALPADVDLAAYRVVQESLTNVIRHAAPARASVSLGYEPDRFTVDVVDEPMAVTQPPSNGTSHRPIPRGHGLAGLAERLDELGGSLTAGPRSGSAPDATEGDSNGTNGRRQANVGKVAGVSSMAGIGSVAWNGNVAGNGNRADNGGAGWRVHAELPLRKAGA